MTDNLYNSPAFTRHMKRILPCVKYTGCLFLLTLGVDPVKNSNARACYK